MTRVLVVSHDVIGPRMAGPGIRYFHIARVLSQHVDTTLAFLHRDDEDRQAIVEDLQPALPDVGLVGFTSQSWSRVLEAARQAEVVVLPSDVAAILPQLGALPAFLVIDGYNPLLAEYLAAHPGVTAQDLAGWRMRMNHLGNQMQLGDFYLCASERQRDWWLGQLEAHGRVNPYTVAADASLRNLIDVASYGVPAGEPEYDGPVIRGLWPQIQVDRRILLWGGGLWPWLDPLTAIRTVAHLQSTRPEVCLVFPGAVHPNPDVAKVSGYLAEAQSLAREWGLLNHSVFFGEWVAYARWPSLLLETDVALSLHHDTLETRLAFRSRVLEYLWCGLPVVSSLGDATGQLAVDFGLGVTAPVGDVAAVAAAVEQCLEMSAERRSGAAREVRRALAWERVLQPLIEFCLAPHRAADRQALGPEGGNPFYQDQIHHWRSRAAEWEAELQAARMRLQDAQQRIEAYERGRFLSLMRWLKGHIEFGSGLGRRSPRG